MKKTLIGAIAAAALTANLAGYAGAQEKQPGQGQAPAALKVPEGQDPPPGTETIDKRAERAQSAAPMSEGQDQKPADAAQGLHKPSKD